MSRPAVTVVMPFAGTAEEGQAALSTLLALIRRAGDELILADNVGVISPPADGPVRVIHAAGERSPAHARNAGAEHAGADWILFLDADCRAPAGLLDAYFAQAPADDVGALAGEVIPAPDAATVAARYGAAKSFLGQEAHLAHSYRPRAVAANLMVRRRAFDQVGGFYEGVRAAEDTDFSWRLQQAGWRLELRPGARVEHHYRATIRALRRQWRGYAAGRAWLARRYEGFEPEPALRRALRRTVRRPRSRGVPSETTRMLPARPAPGRLERARHLALDAVLGVDELTGLVLSNRPARHPAGVKSQVVIIADSFPAGGDPLVEFTSSLEHARVEAVRRPDAVAVEVARKLQIDYREDDGVAARALAFLRFVIRHPLRSVRDRLGRRPGQPGLAALAPAALRLERDRQARLHPLGAGEVTVVARRLAALSGRRLDEPAR
jgi:Glycosyl transferase family group 2